jgi:hypothetical protein
MIFPFLVRSYRFVTAFPIRALYALCFSSMSDMCNSISLHHHDKHDGYESKGCLVTVRPGPVLHVWRDGKEVAVIDLPPNAAIYLASQILKETNLEK